MVDRHDRVEQATEAAIEAAKRGAASARERRDAAHDRADELSKSQLHKPHRVDDASERAQRASDAADRARERAAAAHRRAAAAHEDSEAAYIRAAQTLDQAGNPIGAAAHQRAAKQAGDDARTERARAMAEREGPD